MTIHAAAIAKPYTTANTSDTCCRTFYRPSSAVSVIWIPLFWAAWVGLVWWS